MLDEEWLYISDEAKDLIIKLLRQDPKERLSAKEALKHPWIVKNVYPKYVIPSVLQNMMEYEPQSRLRHAFLRFLVRRFLPVDEEKVLKDNFVEIDKDSNGVLSRKELKLAVFDCFTDKTEKEAKKMVDLILGNLDFNEEGFIPYTSFLVGAVDRNILLKNKYIKRAFRYFDIDKSDRIDWMEFRDRVKIDGELNEDVFRGMIG